MFRFAHELLTASTTPFWNPSRSGSASAEAPRQLPWCSTSCRTRWGMLTNWGYGRAQQALGQHAPTFRLSRRVLLRNAMEYVNTFLLMVAIRKPSGAPDAVFSLGAGSVGSESMPIHRIPHLIGRLFGWNVPQPFPRHVV
jgi:hypothetical protein